jgi:hypothetical protein
MQGSSHNHVVWLAGGNGPLLGGWVGLACQFNDLNPIIIISLLLAPGSWTACTHMSSVANPRHHIISYIVRDRTFYLGTATWPTVHENACTYYDVTRQQHQLSLLIHMFLFVVVYRVDNDQRETGGRSFLFKMDDFATSSELCFIIEF